MNALIRAYGRTVGRGLWWAAVIAYGIIAATAWFEARPGPHLPEKVMVMAGLLVSGLILSIPPVPGLLVWLGVTLSWFLPPNALLVIAASGLAVVLARRVKPLRRPRTILGWRRYVGWPVSVSVPDRMLHVHVLGPTGSGKSSSVLMPLIAQDLAHGRGLTLIEPKGDLSLATERAALATGHTVLYVDPDDSAAPHYNPLAGPGEVAAEGLAFALDQVSQAGHPFYATVARLELLYAVMAVKESHPESADLTTLMQFLRQERFRREVLGQCKDPRTISYYTDQVGQQSQSKAHEQRIGLLNRLELLVVNPTVRNLFTGPSDFTWDEVLAEGYVVICPFSLARLGASARMLGSLFWHGLVMATYRRPTSAPTPYFLYLDEFHQYVTPDLADYLALARGYGVGITLAHQDLGQLSPTLLAAVMANCRQRIVLGGISHDDASVILAGWKTPSDRAPDLRRLARGVAWIERTSNGRVVSPVSVQLRHHPLNSGVL